MIQIVLVIIVYILGPVLFLSWAVKRYKAGGKLQTSELVAVMFSLGLLGLLIYSNLKLVTEGDRDEIQLIVKELTDSYNFPLKAKYQNRPAVDGIAHRHKLEIRIYGVTQKEEQNKIHTIAKRLRKQFSSKPITLSFFKEEVWEEKEDGSRVPRRDQEYLLKKLRVQ